MPLPVSLVIAPADSARAVGDVYGVTLLATLPLVAAWVALVATRRAGAGSRALVCRGALVAMLAIYAGRLLPFHAMAWVVPEGLAAPLVALGRAQLAVVGVIPSAGALTPVMDGTLVQLLLLLYWTGVASVVLVMVWGRWRLRRIATSAIRCSSVAWRARLADAADAAGMSASDADRVQLFESADVHVPMTWRSRGRSVVVLPTVARAWTPAQLRAALVHELSHLRHGDTQFAVLARLACALFWFHPGAWWLSARLGEESEFACDDRVLLSGVRRSDYAELLARALDGSSAARVGVPATGVALVRATGVRGRLAAIVNTTRIVRAPSRLTVASVTLACGALALPVGTVRVAPTRDVLTTLMHDARWESRAYAVVRLAQRADSVEVARDAARHDPSPRVRAWAQYALSQESAPTRVGVAPTDDARSRVAPPSFLH